MVTQERSNDGLNQEHPSGNVKKKKNEDNSKNSLEKEPNGVSHSLDIGIGNMQKL